MSKVVTFGEIMMRLQPPNNDLLVAAKSLDICFGGGEANVAVCLAGLGADAQFVTALPLNSLGEACIRDIRARGVRVGSIVRKEGRMGVYFCEKGFSVRPSKIIYDRKDSVFALSETTDYNWETIFEDADWFHFTGITPALSQSLRNTLLQALKIAKSKNIIVSCDLNYRNKLWTKEQAKLVMENLMQYVDVLVANEEDCKDVFSICADSSDISNGNLSKEGYANVAKQVSEKFGINKVAITMRESYNANSNGWSALLYDGKTHFSKDYKLNVLDRVGGGDSFAAGLIYALRSNFASSEAIEFAVACSAIKHTINGDFNEVSVKDVLHLINNGGNGRVQR